MYVFWLIYGFASHYFDHDAFLHNALHVGYSPWVYI